VLTTAAGDIQALLAFRAGPVGYLLKNLLRSELIDTIRMVHAGQRRIPPEITDRTRAAIIAVRRGYIDLLRPAGRFLVVRPGGEGKEAAYFL